MDCNLKKKLLSCLIDYQRRREEKGAVKRGEQPKISYGTSGFRGNANQIEHLFFNVGLISAVRCMQLKAKIGIMITASHNPVEDNGVKFIDGKGEMLDVSWESIVEEFCNKQDNQALIDQIDFLFTTFKIDVTEGNSCQVLIDQDTRPSSEAFTALVKQGLDVWYPLVSYYDYGQVTTPALHYIVAKSNERKKSSDLFPAREYYDHLINRLVEVFNKPSSSGNDLYSQTSLVVDCANGVGSVTMQNLRNNEEFNRYLPIKIINSGEGILNKFCGSDYVKTTQECPVHAADTSKRYASLDGDADRVVYFYLKDSRVKLLDGDKIMALYALYLKEFIDKFELRQELALGFIQTAYANGASTNFLTKLQFKVDCVDTGVKNLQRQALNYDIAVFFEANGHGTIWVSSKARDVIAKNASGTEYMSVLSLINSYTGDAIADILVVECILRHFNWKIETWDDLYQDRPSVLIAEKVSNRDKFKTKDAGRVLIEPPDLQKKIDLLVQQYDQDTRCFVRPSGTENVVRIYSEARTQELALKLAEEVRLEVKDY